MDYGLWTMVINIIVLLRRKQLVFTAAKYHAFDIRLELLSYAHTQYICS